MPQMGALCWAFSRGSPSPQRKSNQRPCNDPAYTEYDVAGSPAFQHRREAAEDRASDDEVVPAIITGWTPFSKQ